MSNQQFSRVLVNTIALLSLAIAGCNGSGNTETQTKSTVNSNKGGDLTLVANGEDFVRQGFVTKDNWQVNFDRVAVNVGNIKAYQTESTFDVEQSKSNSKIEYREKIALVDEAIAVDLAAGDDLAPPVVVKKVQAPLGSYNVLAWEMIPSEEMNSNAQTIVLEGRAVKDSETVDFKLGFAIPVKYVCGEFVGDARKGIVTQDTPAEVEMTFHFDHIFGDLETPQDDALNQEALGFQPLAALSKSGKIVADWQTLQQQLSVTEREKLTKAIAELGHVGEGHCKAEYEL